MKQSQHAEIVNAYARLLKSIGDLFWKLYLADVFTDEVFYSFLAVITSS